MDFNDALLQMTHAKIMPYFVKYGSLLEVEKEVSLSNPKLSDHYIYYLVSGVASLSSINCEGDVSVFMYFTQDQVLGFASSMLRHYRDMAGIQSYISVLPDLSFGIEAKTKCRFYRMEEKQFLKLMQEDHQFLYCMMEVAMFHYASFIKKVQNCHDGDAKAKFAYCLLSLSRKQKDIRVVPKVFTYVELARYLDMHPVTVSKLAMSLKDEGIIDKKEGCIRILDEDALKAYLYK